MDAETLNPRSEEGTFFQPVVWCGLRSGGVPLLEKEKGVEEFVKNSEKTAFLLLPPARNSYRTTYRGEEERKQR